MDCWIPPRSSETCGSSYPADTPESIEALRTWLREAFPASRSASQGSEPGAQTTATCGPPSATLYARFDPGTCSLRTFQDYLPGMEEATSGESSLTFPRSGLLSDGRCWELTMSAPRTGGSGCGYSELVITGDRNHFVEVSIEANGLKTVFPTPTVPSGGHTSRSGNRRDEIPGLEGMARRGMWPTPTEQDSSNTAGPSQLNRNSLPLNAAVGGTSTRRNWPTPDARDSHAEGLESGMRRIEKYGTQGLQTAVKTWPTPRFEGGRTSPDINQGNRSGNGAPDLATAVARMWPTPTVTSGAQTAESPTPGQTGGTTLPGAVITAEKLAAAFPSAQYMTQEQAYRAKGSSVGQLNPTWVEWLMGFPLGYTALTPMNLEDWNDWLRKTSCEKAVAAFGLDPRTILCALRGAGNRPPSSRSLQAADCGASLPNVSHKLARRGSPRVGEAICGDTLEEPRQNESVRSVRKTVHLHETAPDGVQSDLREPRRMGAQNGCLTPESTNGRSEICDEALAWREVVPRVATGVTQRVARLRALGNGQVPLSAAAAWVRLGGA